MQYKRARSATPPSTNQHRPDLIFGLPSKAELAVLAEAPALRVSIRVDRYTVAEAAGHTNAENGTLNRLVSNATHYYSSSDPSPGPTRSSRSRSRSRCCPRQLCGPRRTRHPYILRHQVTTRFPACPQRYRRLRPPRRSPAPTARAPSSPRSIELRLHLQAPSGARRPTRRPFHMARSPPGRR